MRERARTDLCGGRSAMIVPTATLDRRGAIRCGTSPVVCYRESNSRGAFRVFRVSIMPWKRCESQQECRPISERPQGRCTENWLGPLPTS
jgi:hypothetical protein